MCFHVFHPLLPSFREGVAGMGCQRRAKDLKELERLERGYYMSYSLLLYIVVMKVTSEPHDVA